MASEYVHISDALPSLASEVIHRIAELLKVFNARTCQLVLGAGAMQVFPFFTFVMEFFDFTLISLHFIVIYIEILQRGSFLLSL
jgi:vacuolar protein sorting-associated protein 54